MSWKLFAAAMALLLLLVPAPALAHGSPSNAIVHEEIVKVGPHLVRVGFSDWPLRAKKSAEYTVHPPGGIAGQDAFVSEPFTVMIADPPGVPEWLGWAVGLIPLYGSIWFGFRERQRVRLAMAAE